MGTRTGSRIGGRLPSSIACHGDRSSVLGGSGRTRSAFLDAATAVELALATWLRDRINPQRPYASTAVLKRVPMLGPRLQFARDFGLIFPSDFQQRLLEPRNRVTHAGWSPSRQPRRQSLPRVRSSHRTHTLAELP